MRRLAWLIVPVILLVLLGVAMFAARGPMPTTAFTLRPGDCFDIPTGAQVGDIATIDCTSPHDAEVFMAGTIGGVPAAIASPSVAETAAAPDPVSTSPSGSEPPSEVASEVASAPVGLPGYPGDAAIASWVSANCGFSAQQAYLGAEPRTDLVVGYFFPNADAWIHGERQVTCYLHAVGSKLSAPLRSGAASASPS